MPVCRAAQTDGRQRLVRHGHLPERSIMTGIGAVEVCAPRVRDRLSISTGDFAEALSALLGPNAGGLSASTIVRLKEVWADEHARWLKRDLSVKRYVYFWADGI
jgi:hypothetical protein